MSNSIALILDMHGLREHFCTTISKVISEFKDKVHITRSERYISDDLFIIVVIEVVQVLNNISKDPYNQKVNFNPNTMSHSLYFDIHEYAFNDIERYLWECEYIVEESIDATLAQKCALDITSTAVSYLSRISKCIVANMYQSRSLQEFYNDNHTYVKEIDIHNNGPSSDLTLIITLDSN